MVEENLRSDNSRSGLLDLDRESCQEPCKSNYKTFLNREKKCPTCKGTGKIYQEEENKLVALIPVSDNRLKPKRIWLWMLLTLSICIVIVILLVFWLSPRKIIISAVKSDVYPYNFTLITDKNSTTLGIILEFEEVFRIKNENYFSVSLKNLSLQLNRNSHITLPKISYTKDFVLPSRANVDFSVFVKYIMYSLNDPYAGLCITGVLNNLFCLISSSFTFSTLWDSSMLQDTSRIQYIYCSNKTLSRY
ncbi:transmembrane protein -like [Brachionus plicatilis]|uniref:Transmembrane protein-like n=1 Tax=Brachionus plicatilis TaxID=10195 RepID=A0A3M7S358_BRAPC|nr:transmembrane protein -like [Brachionus plicatilis]